MWGGKGCAVKVALLLLLLLLQHLESFVFLLKVWRRDGGSGMYGKTEKRIVRPYTGAALDRCQRHF
jgi:hypothetical protein